MLAEPDSTLTAAKGPGQRGLFYGWTVAIASLFIIMVLSGIHYTYGVFFKPLLQEFGWSRAVTSGAFSFYMVLYGLMTPVAGVLTDRYGPRVTVTACGILMGIGFLLMSLVNAAWQLYMIYGLLVGVGYSAGYAPPLSTTARWFLEKRGLALGIVVSGVGIGAMVMAPLIRYFISSYGWRTAYIIVGLIVWAVVIPAALMLRRDPKDVGVLPYGQRAEAQAQKLATSDAATVRKERSSLTLREAVRRRAFWAVLLMYLLAMIGGQMVVIHLVPYGTDIGLSAATAATLLTLFGGFGIVGRLLMGVVSDRIGGRATIALCLGAQAVVMLWLTFGGSPQTIYFFAAIFGFVYGGAVTMFPTITGELFGVQAMGGVFGGITGGAGIGSATGPFLAGFIFDVTGSYHFAFLSGAVILAAAAVIALLLRKAKRPNTM